MLLKNNVYTSSDLSYLTGSLLGDGCLYVGKNSYQFSITSEDYDFCEMCFNLVKDIFGKKGRIKTIKKDGKISYYQLVVCSKKIVNFFLEETLSKKRIPSYVYTNDNTIKSFMQGLMDSDGWICKVNASDGYIRYRVGFKNISEWTMPFKVMFSNLGVKTGKLREITNDRYGKPSKNSYTFSINTLDYCNKIGFRILRKQKIQKEYLNAKN